MFTIGVTARLTGLSQRQLRSLEAKQIVVAGRTTRGRRLYSLYDLERLRFLGHLMSRRKVNTAGLVVALELLDRLPQQERNQYLETVLVEDQATGEPDESDPL